MSHEPFSMFYHNELMLFDCFFVMMYCIGSEACMRAKKYYILTIEESIAKICRQ